MNLIGSCIPVKLTWDEQNQSELIVNFKIYIFAYIYMFFFLFYNYLFSKKYILKLSGRF